MTTNVHAWPKPKPQARYVLVSPELANEWLASSNVFNRPLSMSTVKRYVADMQSGRWRDSTGEPIIFDRLGRLQDGQHRLSAVVASGVSVSFLVVSDTDPDDFHVINQGKRRSASDVLNMSGVADARTAAAITRFLIMLQTARHLQWGSQNSPTQQHAIEYALEHQSHIAWANLQSGQARRNALLPRSAYGAVAGYVSMTSSNMESWERFHERVCSGAMLKESEPEYTLRKWAVNRQHAVNTQSIQHAVAVITKAWNASVSDRPLSLLRWRREELPMPEPLPST